MMLTVEGATEARMTGSRLGSEEAIVLGKKDERTKHGLKAKNEDGRRFRTP